MTESRGPVPPGQKVEPSELAGRWRAPKSRAVSRRRSERHPGKLYPGVGFSVPNLVRPDEQVVAFYNVARRSNGQEGKGATMVFVRGGIWEILA